MIRVHVLQVRYPPGIDGSGNPRVIGLRIDLDLCPERIDTVQGVDKMMRAAFALPPEVRAIVRYDCAESPGGHRLYAVSDSRDSVSRQRENYYRRVYGPGGGEGEKPTVPDYLPEDM